MQRSERLRVLGALFLGSAGALAVSWHATQWLAGHWAYHPSLGASVLVSPQARLVFLGAVPVGVWLAWRWLRGRRVARGVLALVATACAVLGSYPALFAPWGIYRWVRWSEGTGDEAVVAPVLYAAVTGSAIAVLGSLVFAAWRNREEARGAKLASSRYATEGELRSAEILVPKRTPRRDEAAGVILGLPKRGEGLLRTAAGKPANVLVAAPPRTGKGIGIVNPNVLDPCAVSRVVIDPKGEIFIQASRWLEEQGFHVLRFDPTRHPDATASSWNPLHELRADPTFGPGDAMRLARMVADPNGKAADGTNPFFFQAGSLLLQGLILEALLGDTMPRSLAGIAEATSGIGEVSETLFERLRSDGAHPKVRSVAAQMLAMAEETRANVESTVFSYLGLFDDTLTRQHLERSDFSLLDLVTAERPVALFVTVPEVASPLALPIVRMFMQMLLWALSDRLRGAEAKWRLRIIADEFASFGPMPEWRSALGRLPGIGKGVDTILVVQTAMDLAYNYRDVETIADLCDYKVVLRSQGRSAKWISEALGEREISRARRSWRAGSLKERGQVSSSEDKRALLTADEISRLGLDEVLIVAAGQYPYRGRLIRHYEDPPWAARVRGETTRTSRLGGASKAGSNLAAAAGMRVGDAG